MCTSVHFELCCVRVCQEMKTCWHRASFRSNFSFPVVGQKPQVQGWVWCSQASRPDSPVVPCPNGSFLCYTVKKFIYFVIEESHPSVLIRVCHKYEVVRVLVFKQLQVFTDTVRYLTPAPPWTGTWPLTNELPLSALLNLVWGRFR